MFELNLQYFAKDGPGGEKTEQPTEKRKKDSRKEGQVAKSKELDSAVGLFALFVILKIYVGTMGTRFIENFSYVYSSIPDFCRLPEGQVPGIAIRNFFMLCMSRILLILAPLLAVAFVVAFVINLVQVKWAPTTKPLQPKLSKLNPVKGIKRIFSKEKIIELLESIVKLIIIGWLAYSTLSSQIGILFHLYDMTVLSALQVFGNIVINLGIKISAVYLIIGIADYMYQKWKHNENLKMTKQEVKDEYKNAEGDPKIKGKQRQRMQEASRRRMMQAVPQADVVITNPTHFAVALKYDPDVAPAPYVVAKGEDFLAKKIKEEAKANNVEIVENKPLARMLYYNVDLGAQIPPELYMAVADILAAIYNKRDSA